VRGVTRRAAIGFLAGAVCGCASGPVETLKRLRGPSEDPSASGKMIDRYTKRDFDRSSLAGEQDRILRLQRAEARYGLLYAPEFHTYLDCVMRRLLVKAPVPDLPARAVLVTSRDWTPYSTPPGIVFVPMKFVEALDDEDQAAFALSHEISHILFRHHDSDWLVKGQKHAIAVGELAMAAQTAVERRNPKNPVVSPSGMRAAKAMLTASDKIIAPAWSRTQEEQADLLGIDIMVAAGYNPQSALEVLEKLVKWRKGPGQVYADAPRDLAKELAEWTRPASGKGDPGTQAALADLQRQLIGVISQSSQELLQKVSQPYPDPEERLKLAREYVDREYADLTPPDVSDRPWKSARSKPQIREIFQRYEWSFTAMDKLQDHDLREAERRAQEGLKGFTRTHNFPHFALAEVYGELRRSDRVAENLRAALEAPEPALESSLRLATLHERANRTREALQVLEAARPKFADHPRMWPDLIRIYRRVGRAAEASQLQLRCQVEFPDFKKLCDEGAQRPG
jgi:beta-barrel assembly-enhancing protease